MLPVCGQYWPRWTGGLIRYKAVSYRGLHQLYCDLILMPITAGKIMQRVGERWEIGRPGSWPRRKGAQIGTRERVGSVKVVPIAFKSPFWALSTFTGLHRTVSEILLLQVWVDPLDWQGPSMAKEQMIPFHEGVYGGQNVTLSLLHCCSGGLSYSTNKSQFQQFSVR